MSELSRLIIFDADGVLIDACHIHFRAFQQALREVGVSLSHTEHQLRLNARPTKDKLAILAATHPHLRELIDSVAARKQEITHQIFTTELVEDQTKIELISALRSHGFLIACASNSLRSSVEVMLRATGILSLFDYYVGNDDAAPKPAPDLYLACADALGVPMARTVIVEDSPLGLAAARSAGALSVIDVADPSEVTLSLLSRLLSAFR